MVMQMVVTRASPSLLPLKGERKGKRGTALTRQKEKERPSQSSSKEFRKKFLMPEALLQHQTEHQSASILPSRDAVRLLLKVPAAERGTTYVAFAMGLTPWLTIRNID